MNIDNANPIQEKDVFWRNTIVIWNFSNLITSSLYSQYWFPLEPWHGYRIICVPA